MQITATQLEQVNKQIQALVSARKFLWKEIRRCRYLWRVFPEDFTNLPFQRKMISGDLSTWTYDRAGRKNRPDSFFSGTTGLPVIIPYTAKDVEDWAVMFKRCYEMAGITNLDRIQITPGYGLWTAGIGFQNGAEKLGAMVIPMGPGNTDKQLQMMLDMKSTVLCSTSSYALLLAEEIENRGIQDQIHLKKGVIGSERWGEKNEKAYFRRAGNRALRHLRSDRDLWSGYRNQLQRR